MSISSDRHNAESHGECHMTWHHHHYDLTLGVLKHDPGGCDVVGRADVVVDLCKLLRHVGQLVLNRIVNARFSYFIIAPLTNIRSQFSLVH